MADLAAWLERIGLGEYAGAFAEAAIDLDVLPDLTEADLADLGVRLGDRKRLLKAIAARGDEAAHPHPLPAREVPAQAPPLRPRPMIISTGTSRFFSVSP